MYATTNIINNCTILVVDDDFMMQKGVFEMLKDVNVRILAAPEAKTGLMLAQKKQPDLILMDWNMPGLSGLEALHLLRDNPATAHIPVIIMTALSVSSFNAHTALTSGADDFLKKPFDCYELIGRLTAALRQSHTQQELYHQKAALEKLSEEQKQLLSILSHDLKSPLNNIEALVSLTKLHLNEESPDSEPHKHLDLISSIVKQEQDLINQILEMHRFETMQVPQEHITINLHSWLIETLAPFKKNQKEIRIELDVQTLITIQSIPVFLKKVIDNLVSNALKYSHPNTIITISVTDLGDQIKLSIRDQGQGFHPDEVGDIFQKFKKFSAKPTGGESSSGIGLYIVKNIVGRLGGSIKLNTQYKRGSEFLINIPKKLSKIAVS